MNERERISYVKALVYIALADDTVEEGEDKYLEQIGNIYGISGDAIEGIKDSVKNKKESLNEVLSDITDRKIKLSLIYDLLAICYADDNYSVVEKQGMKNICEILDIEPEKLTQLENIMEEQLELQKKINIILER